MNSSSAEAVSVGRQHATLDDCLGARTRHGRADGGSQLRARCREREEDEEREDRRRGGGDKGVAKARAERTLAPKSSPSHGDQVSLVSVAKDSVGGSQGPEDARLPPAHDT